VSLDHQHQHLNEAHSPWRWIWEEHELCGAETCTAPDQYPYQVDGISLPMPEIPSTRSLAPFVPSSIHGPSTRPNQTSHLAVSHLVAGPDSPELSQAPRSDSPEMLQAPTSKVHVQTLLKSTAPDKFSGTDKHQDFEAWIIQVRRFH
jgi:hypothetical protein